MWTQTNLTGYFFVTKLSLSKRDQEQNVCFENGLICMRIKDHSISIASYLASLWNRVLVQLEIGLLFLSIRHLHISHNTPCLPSPHLRKKKLHKHHVANFSWEHCYSQEKLKTKATNFFFFGGGGARWRGQQGVLWEIRKWRIVYMRMCGCYYCCACLRWYAVINSYHYFHSGSRWNFTAAIFLRQRHTKVGY